MDRGRGRLNIRPVEGVTTEGERAKWISVEATTVTKEGPVTVVRQLQRDEALEAVSTFLAGMHVLWPDLVTAETGTIPATQEDQPPN